MDRLKYMVCMNRFSQVYAEDTIRAIMYIAPVVIERKDLGLTPKQEEVYCWWVRPLLIQLKNTGWIDKSREIKVYLNEQSLRALASHVNQYLDNTSATEDDLINESVMFRRNYGVKL